MSIQIRTDRDAWRMVPVGEIQPYERNAKIHGPEQLRLLRRSLRESGFVRPLLVDEELRLIAGHGVLEAARAEGMERVPCVVVTGLTEAQRRAYILADNKLSELAPWDEGILALELPELEALDVDVSALGFEPLGDADPPAKADGDAAAPEEGPPPVVSPPLARRGDLWTLGPHRVMCGDCTSRGDVEALLGVVEGARGVLDLFGGSLSTMMACDQVGQPCYSMELSPEFVSTGIRRWAEVHGWEDVRCIRDGRELTAGEAGVEI